MIWRCYYVKLGGHVHCRLFCGPIEGALGKCGDVSFRAEEFTEFTRIRQVLAVDFVRETNADGSLKGDDDVQFLPTGAPTERAPPESSFWGDQRG